MKKTIILLLAVVAFIITLMAMYPMTASKEPSTLFLLQQNK